MGIVEEEFASVRLGDGTECRIEMNKNGVAHVHIGRSRLDLSREELVAFLGTVSEAKAELERVKDL